MRRLKAAVMAMLLTAAAAAPSACVSRSPSPLIPGSESSADKPPTANSPADLDSPVPVWPFWPTHMRVHPLSRLVSGESGGPLVIEARIEFADATGAITKAVGQLTIQLFASDSSTNSAAPPGANEPVQNWNQDLRDLSVNNRQFDDVTRTYLFRLQLDPSAMPEKPELRAFFLSADGQRMDATLKLRR